MYGPTETTVWSLIHRVHSGSGVVPIGRPIANTKIYVLDAHGAPAPVGVTGKLYISGEGLALGYNNRPELTSEKFVVSPLPECGGERIYDTGDLARCQADGCVEWQGRADNQVKIRGYRIELEEIESVLRRHKGVSEAVVVVRTGSLLAGHSGDDRRLAAYLLPSGPAVPSSSDIRRHTARFLPDYMVPSAFIFLDTLPLTPNGKVDRNAMPEPDAASHRDSGRETIGPNSPLEATLLRIFEQVLTVSPLSVTDDFFESGGNSLLAYQLVSGIVRHTGHDIPLAALFQAPTVRKLARKLEDRTYDDAWSALVELRKGNGSGAEPLFCTHWLDAELFTFHRIASLLRDDRPVYGLQATAPESPESPIIGIKAMAAAYARQIRSCYPHGPYNLAGSCLGGVVAFETARQLVAAGERVGLLILIDAFMPGPLQYLHTRPYLLEQMDRYCGEFLLSPAAAMKRWARESVTRLAGTVRGQGTYSRVSGRLRKLSAEAEERYRPEPYSGKVTLLICSDGPSRAYEDRRLGWAAVADGGFEVHVVPGNHSTMEQEPNIQVIAERIQRCFDASSDLKAVNTSVAAAGVVLPRRLRFQEETK
jgi:thioesterase domain-containing protein